MSAIWISLLAVLSIRFCCALSIRSAASRGMAVKDWLSTNSKSAVSSFSWTFASMDSQVYGAVMAITAA